MMITSNRSPPPTRSKLGLGDQRVVICNDRGNKYHWENYDPTSMSTEHVISPVHHDRSEDLIQKIFDELDSAVLFSELGATTNPYVPRSKLRQILTPERISHAINHLPGFEQLPHEEKQTVAQEICNGGGRYCRRPCVKVLALSICIDRGSSFFDLMKRKATDDCLPPFWDGRGPIECRSCKSSHILPDRKTKAQKGEFIMWAHALNAPYFTSPTEEGKHHVHYVLTPEDVLPIVEIKPASKNPRHAQSQSGDHSAAYGGYSHVRQIRLHPDHYDLPFPNKQDKQYEYFALKELNSPNLKDFNMELASLLTFQSSTNKHIIHILTSFEVKGKDSSKFYLVFAWAKGNLCDFWETHDPIHSRPPRLCRWMAEQSYGLAQALVEIHNDRRRNIRNMDHIKEEDSDLYGIHGDIKAENVLWFEGRDRLVIADFGLGRLHTKISRSNGDPSKISGTTTYQAPEFEMKTKEISRVSDVFSLGCMFLELITWYLEGYESVNTKFPDHRTEKDSYGFYSDNFFCIQEPGHIPIIKPKVKQWIQQLRDNDNCNYFIIDFLDLIEHRMLVPYPKTRISSEEVAGKLYVFSKTCRVDSSYYKEYV